MTRDLHTVIPINAQSVPAWSGEPESELMPDTFTPAGQRPLMQKISYPPRVTMNGLLLSGLCSVLLVLMGYVALSFPSPLNLVTKEALLMDYNFQLPLTLFFGAMLGPFMGAGVTLIFLLTGLFAYPVFANGGGLDYLLQPSFGYLAGMFIGAYLVGKSFHRSFQKNRTFSRSWKLFTLALFGCLTIHAVGIVYMALLAIFQLMPLGELQGWVTRLTVEPLPYDILAAFFFLCMVRQIRLCLWVVLY